MKRYRIIEVVTGKVIAEKELSSDKSAKGWLGNLLERGVIAGIAVQLEILRSSNWETL